MTIYKSKISLAFVLPIALVLLGASLMSLYDRLWLSLIVLVPLWIFIIHLFFTTYYSIEDKYLKVKSGFLINCKIEISRIRKITETRSIISAPALSLDRIELFYNKFDSIILSPKDKDGFIAHLQQLNPVLEVQKNKTAN
ncbi:Bacterial PH domain protein [compost metagenome]